MKRIANSLVLDNIIHNFLNEIHKTFHVMEVCVSLFKVQLPKAMGKSDIVV
jgi:hypothetical protein